MPSFPVSWFEDCKPGQYQYCVEFTGQKSKVKERDYYSFLEDMGDKVFYKNINLNYSVGKARFRPWAEKGGCIAANATTFNRELLIVEKENNAKTKRILDDRSGIMLHKLSTKKEL